MTMYVAGIGMLTPVGINTATTSAAIKAGISAYQLSRFEGQQGVPAKMTEVPKQLFDTIKIELDSGIAYQEQYGRIIKMAVHAIKEALVYSAKDSDKIIPLILSLQEPSFTFKPISPQLLVNQLIKLGCLPVNSAQIRPVCTGRAASIDGLALAQHFLEQSICDYVLIGGSDSYHSAYQLDLLDQNARLLHSSNSDGFAPGEGAGFLLVTKHIEKAITKNEHVIKINPPGFAREQGHIYCAHPYHGEGLDSAFKLALKNYHRGSISTVYSSMNGERYWAKEYGVAMIRNAPNFSADVETLHPADCYGDLGAATGGVLMGLSATHLLKQPHAGAHLVYCSSDGEYRAAVCLEKVPL